MLELDHLVVSAATLDEGAAWVYDSLGIAPGPGGRHAHMGTHNRVMRLGPGEYLEVIAVDPEAPQPAHARWFGLDRFSGPPRITNWVLRTDTLEDALAAAPEGAGVPVRLTRGDYHWAMGIPPSGEQPFDDCFPPLIEWHSPRPVDRMADLGLRLVRLEIAHPEAKALHDAVRLADPRVVFVPGPRAMRAEIDTPHGRRVLG